MGEADDRGIYRIAAVAGRYIVFADPEAYRLRVGPDAPAWTYARTFFPASRDIFGGVATP